MILNCSSSKNMPQCTTDTSLVLFFVHTWLISKRMISIFLFVCYLCNCVHTPVCLCVLSRTVYCHQHQGHLLMTHLSCCEAAVGLGLLWKASSHRIFLAPRRILAAFGHGGHFLTPSTEIYDSFSDDGWCYTDQRD